jgi:hypothetical protein
MVAHPVWSGLVLRTARRKREERVSLASKVEEGDNHMPGQSPLLHGSKGAIYARRCSGTTSRLKTSSSVSRRRMIEA